MIDRFIRPKSSLEVATFEFFQRLSIYSYSISIGDVIPELSKTNGYISLILVSPRGGGVCTYVC